MTPEAERHALPFSESAPDGAPPIPEAAPNLFAPISTANRITGRSRTHRQHAQSQLVPGSQYDYGRTEYQEFPSSEPDAYPDEVPLGLQKSVPPTFLRRTLASPASQTTEKGMPTLPLAAYPGSILTAQDAPFGVPSPFFPARRPDVSTDPTPSAAPACSPFGIVAPLTEPPYARAAVTPGVPFLPKDAALPGALFGGPAMAGSGISAADGYGAEGPDPVSEMPGSAVADGALIPAPGEPYVGFASSPDAAAPADPPPATVTRAAYQPPPAAASYVPRHGRASVGRMVDLPPMAEPAVDPWEAMGWKAPAGQAENTAVWRISDLTMFERGAFEEPPNPFTNPMPVGDMSDQEEPGAPQGIPPAPNGALGAVLSGYPYPETEPMPYGGEAYAPYPAQDEPAYRQPSLENAGREEAYADAPENPRPYRPALPMRNPRAQSVHARHGSWLAAVAPWRLALWVGCALALVFLGVEMFKIVESLVTNEQQMRQVREQYYQMAGVDPASAVSGVELLPAGETYTPTATPVPVLTPTPEPRVPQNDPLIGVIDSGGRSTASFAPALPTATPLTRTKLTKYPDNALLSISDAFAELRRQNPDVVGRLTIDGVLDETLVQRNNTFYLTHNVRGVYGKTGAVFVDEGCSLKKPPENLLLRGQTTTEGKLFAPLLNYGTGGADFIRQHGIVTCDTIYEQGRFVVFAVVRADSSVNSKDYFNYAGYLTFQTDAQMLNYVAAARAHSLYAIDVGVRADDRLLTMATIAEGNGTTCLVVFCRRLRNGESEGNIQRD